MQVTLLGPVAAHNSGVPLTLGGRKQRSVFALLALDANRTVSLDRLVYEIWRDEPPAQATLALQAYISRLRRAFAGADTGVRISTRPPGWALEIPPRQVDSIRFADLVAEGRGLLADGRSAAAAQALRAGLALWTGEPLADLADSEFAVGDVVRLSEQRLDATEFLLEAELAIGNDALVVSMAQDVVAAHPYRERGWAALVVALYRSGRQADALAEIRRLRATLSEGLGLDPSARIRELETMILDQDPALTGVVVEARTQPSTSRVHPPADDRLVGRAAELDAVVAAVSASAAGAGRMVIVEGSAGLGKSSVLSRLQGAVEAGQGLVLSAAGVGTVQMPALWAWVTVVRRLGEVAPDVLRAALSEPAGQALSMLDPSLDVDAQPRAGDSTLGRTRLYRAVIDLLHAARSRGPVAVLLDDAQWLDPETLDLLALAVAELLSHGVLFAVALRPDESTENRHSLDRIAAVAGDAVVRLPLRGLDGDDVARLVGRVSATDADPDVVTAILARTAGNPLFVVELTQLLVSERRLDPSSVYEVLPSGVRDVLRRRLDRLPEQSLAALTVLALLGRAAPAELIGRAASMTGDAVLDACEAAVLTGLLIDEDGLAFELSHDLVRQTLDEAVTPSRRVQWHARIAAALLAGYPNGEPTTPDQIVELTDHHMHAVAILGVEPALRYLLLAADDAFDRMAPARSEAFLESALELAAQLTEPQARERRTTEIRSRLATGRIILRADESAPVDSVALSAAGGMAPLDPGAPGDWYNTAIRLMALGQNDTVFRAATTELREGLPPNADAYVHFFLGMGCFEFGRTDDARRAFVRGEQLHEAAPAGGARPILSATFAAVTRTLLGCVETLAGDDAAAADYFASARGLPDPNLVQQVTVEFWAGWCAAQRGDHDGAATAAQACASYAGEVGPAIYVQGSRIFAGWSAAMRGDAAGLRQAADAFDSYFAQGMRHQITTLLSLRAEAHARLGELDRARQLIAESRDWSERIGERTLGPRLRARCGQLLQD